MPAVYQAILGWSLALAATGIVVPQLVHVLRSKKDAGIALRTVVLATASLVAWMGFTLQQNDAPAFASSFGPFVVWAAVGLVVAARRAQLLYVIAALSTAVVAVIYLGRTYDAFQFFAVVGSLCWIVPQVIAAVRTADLSGVSILAYGLLFAENAGWILYALATSTFAYAIAPIVQGPLALIVASMAYRSRRRVQRSAGSEPAPALMVCRLDSPTDDVRPWSQPTAP